MILLLGSSGYIGQAFVAELRRRKHAFEGLTRKTLDYTNFDVLFDFVRKTRPRFLINAAGYTGSPNVDACEDARSLTLQGNVGFPQMLSRVCNMTKTPWGHISSGCIYSGAKVLDPDRGVCRVERNLSEPRLQSLFVTEPQRFYGFTES